MTNGVQNNLSSPTNLNSQRQQLVLDVAELTTTNVSETVDLDVFELP